MISGPKPGAETDRLHFTYDAWNRLVAVWADDDGDPGDLIATYQYDGLGRRTAKIVRQVDGEDVTYQRTDYLYDEQWQVLEERADTFENLEGEGGALATAAETVNVQWLWDQRYIDAPVLRWRDADLDTETGYLGLEETLYICDDANMNVTALVSASGTVEERYVYEVYGKPAIYDGDWQPVAWEGSKQNDVLYCGYRWDFETGLYQVRRRYYHPTLGRWVVRDPLEYAYAGSTRNLYEYTYSAPGCYTDPLGTVPAIPMDKNGPCGKFIIREAIVPIPHSQQRSNEGKTSRKGFEVQFDKKGCEKACCDSIRLVQAVESNGLTGDMAHFDVSVASSNENATTPGGIPPPAYTASGLPGNHGPLSYLDAPNNPRKFYGSTTFSLTACAVCTRKGQQETLLGCVNFTYDDVSGNTNIPGAKPHVDQKNKPDGQEIEPDKPGYPWEGGWWYKGAMQKWTEGAGK